MREATTLVLGGSGKTGRRVVEHLKFVDHVRDVAKSGAWNTPAMEIGADERRALSAVDGPFIETKEL